MNNNDANRLRDLSPTELEEFKTLRDEIIHRQDARIKTIEFIIAILGAIVGFISIFFRFFLIDNPALNLEIIFNLILAFTIFALIIIGAALVLTIKNTEQIQILGTYIMEYLEKDTTLNWQTRWSEYTDTKFKKNMSIHFFSVPGGTKKAIAVFYALLTIPFMLLTAYFYQQMFPTITTINKIFLVIIVVFFIYDLIASITLYYTRSKSWKGIK